MSRGMRTLFAGRLKKNCSNRPNSDLRLFRQASNSGFSTESASFCRSDAGSPKLFATLRLGHLWAGFLLALHKYYTFRATSRRTGHRYRLRFLRVQRHLGRSSEESSRAGELTGMARVIA